MHINTAKKVTLFFLFLSLCQTSQSITVVYSMKIRRAFAQARYFRQERDKRLLWVLSILPIAYYRSRHFRDCVPLVDIKEKRLLFGSVFNIRCIPTDCSWLELTTAVENERSKAKGISNSPVLPVVCGSRTGFDDIVLSGGYNFFLTDKAQIVFYGIGGVPTRRKITKQDALGTFVGTRFFSIGFGGEASYSFVESIKRAAAAIVQTRYIHFFSRNWTPVLPCCSTIQPGDTIDLLLSIRYREKRELFEAGYNPTFFVNQAATTPTTGKVHSDNFVRNGGYVTYAHLFDQLKHPVLLGAGFAYNKTDVLESTIFSGWLNFTVVF